MTAKGGTARQRILPRTYQHLLKSTFAYAFDWSMKNRPARGADITAHGFRFRCIQRCAGC